MKKALILLATIPFIASCGVGGQEFYAGVDSASEKITNEKGGSTTYTLARFSVMGFENTYKAKLNASDFEAKKGSDSYKGDLFVQRTESGYNNFESFYFIVESSREMNVVFEEGSWPAIMVAFNPSVDETFDFYLKNTKLSMGDLTYIAL